MKYFIFNSYILIAFGPHVARLWTLAADAIGVEITVQDVGGKAEASKDLQGSQHGQFTQC